MLCVCVIDLCTHLFLCVLIYLYRLSLYPHLTNSVLYHILSSNDLYRATYFTAM